MGIIKQKWGKCADCEEGAKDQPLTAGRCPMHYKIFRSLVSEEKSRTRSSKLIVNERTNRIFGQPISSSIETIQEFKKGMTAPPKDEQTEHDNELSEWFEYVATFIKATPQCWNCKTVIPIHLYQDPKDKVILNRLIRSASAHVIPKSLFPSVATHPLNFLILGAGCCHGLYDHSIEKASKLPVWKLATERFKMFEPEIKESHKFLDLFKSKI